MSSNALQTTPLADCYSSADRGFMLWGQRIRAKLLAPVLKALANCGITANHVTFLSFLVGIAACPVLLVDAWAGVTLLALHVALDGLDGPLARHMGQENRGGSFADTVVDQTVVAATTATFILAGIVSPLPAVLYVFVYTLVVAFSMVRNALSIPYSWLIRPRIWVYLWFVVETAAHPGGFDWVLWIVSAVLTWKAYTGFSKIRSHLSAAKLASD